MMRERLANSGTSMTAPSMVYPLPCSLAITGIRSRSGKTSLRRSNGWGSPGSSECTSLLSRRLTFENKAIHPCPRGQKLLRKPYSTFCLFLSSRYNAQFFSSSSLVPSPTISPLSKTRIRSTMLRVLKRWAMMNTVRFFANSTRAC